MAEQKLSTKEAGSQSADELRHRHLLGLATYEADELHLILNTAREFRRTPIPTNLSMVQGRVSYAESGTVKKFGNCWVLRSSVPYVASVSPTAVTRGCAASWFFIAIL